MFFNLLEIGHLPQLFYKLRDKLLNFKTSIIGKNIARKNLFSSKNNYKLS